MPPHNRNMLSIMKNTVAVTYVDEGALYASQKIIRIGWCEY